MDETKPPPVTYGVATAGATGRARVVRNVRALAREVLRAPTRLAIRALSELDGKIFGGPSEPVEDGTVKSRVEQRARKTAPSVVVAPPPPSPARKVLPVIQGSASPSPLTSAAPRPQRTKDLPRVLLLNPPRYRGIPVSRFYRSEYLFVDEHAIPSTDLAYFAAAAKGKAHLALIEANAEDLSNEEVVRRMEEFKPDIIVTKALVNVLEHDLTTSMEYKRRNPHVKIVMCSRSSLGTEQALFEQFPLLDGIARGEVDAFAGDICANTELDGIPGLSRPGTPATLIRVVENLDEHPIPAFEMMPKVWYRGAMSGKTKGFSSLYYGIPSGYYVISSRGCPYTCTYCMTGGIHGRPFRWRKRSPENIVEEAKQLWKYGIRDFYFYDEIFTMPGHAEVVSEKLAQTGLDFHFVCDGKPDLVTLPMLKLMKRAGAIAVYYGVESGDEQILREVEKGHTADDALRAISFTREANILAGAYVMLGFPSDSIHTILRTAAFLLRARPDMIRYGFLMPYPVTVLHDEMVKAGLLDFKPQAIDRHINPNHDAGISHSSNVLSPSMLKMVDRMFRLAFATELARSPSIPTA